MRELFWKWENVAGHRVTARKKSNFRPQASKQAETSNILDELSGAHPETLVCKQLSLHLGGPVCQAEQTVTEPKGQVRFIMMGQAIDPCHL